MRPVNVNRVGIILSSTLLLVVTGCGRAASNVEDSQTHWLGNCGTSVECEGDLECVCGHCVAECDADESCAVPGMTTTCAADDSDAVAALCSGHAQVRLCLEECNRDEDCGNDQACEDALCIPASLASSGGGGGSTGGGANTGGQGTAGSEPQGGSGGGTTGQAGGGGASVGVECQTLTVGECEAAGCALLSGTEASGPLNGQQNVYGCDDPERSCPPSGVCAHDPDDTNHVVWFGGCAPDGWLPDRSDPSACDGLLTVDCAALREPACLSTPACTQLYGSAQDGNSVFAGCAPANIGGDGAVTCATDGNGKSLLFPTTTIPEGWTSQEDWPNDIELCGWDCFSPFHDTERALEEGLSGCPCNSAASACVDGVGMVCEDITDDAGYDPYWIVSEQPCNTEIECSGDYYLGECMSRFETCVPSGSIVLDEGTVLYCGDTPLPCGVRSELACAEGCSVLLGTALDGKEAFAGCAELMDCEELAHPPRCVQDQAALNRGETAEPIYLPNVCAAAEGWLELDLEECTSAIEADCASKDAGACVGVCAPILGRKPGGDAGEFVACVYPICNASRIVCAENADGEVKELFGCLAPGWTEIDVGACTAP